MVASDQERPDTQLTQLRAGGQAPYFLFYQRIKKKVKFDQPTDRRMDRWMDKAGCRVEQGRIRFYRASMQGPVLRSLEHLGRSSEVKE